MIKQYFKKSLYVLQENPFRERMSEVFSARRDEGICFEEFLEMMSVFSEQAPRDLKVFYAFKIYGNFLSHPSIMKYNEFYCVIQFIPMCAV